MALNATAEGQRGIEASRLYRYRDAVALLERASSGGDLLAKARLALHYERGRGVAKSPAKARCLAQQPVASEIESGEQSTL